MRIPRRKNQKFHYSPLRYPGGKSFLFPWFDKLIARNTLTNVTYIEPFAGGAGAALALLFMERVDTIVINDLDRAIYSFWKSAITESERFIDKIYATSVTVKEWSKQRAIYSDRRSRRFDLGFATFFLNRTNISGIMGGGIIGGQDQRGKWKIDARYNKDNLVRRIEELAHYENRISITNRDGLELIEKYLKIDNSFIYLDPPYYEKGASLYMNHYDSADHELLAKKLNRNAKANWVLTYDNKEFIRSLFVKRRMFNFSLNHSAYKARAGKEVLILSDALVA